MSDDRACLRASDFALPHQAKSPIALQTAMPAPASDLPDDGLDFTETLRQFERALLQQALTRAQGNKTAAADMLRLPRTTLIHKLRVLEQPVA
jgi:DNA-binding NtrC family response regulator